MIPIVTAAWRWLSTHAAPLIAAALVGYLYKAVDCERDQRAAMERADSETAAAISKNGDLVAAALAVQRDAEKERRGQYEQLEETIRRNRPASRAGACVPSLAERDGVRRNVDAANRYSAGALPGEGAGTGGR